MQLKSNLLTLRLPPEKIVSFILQSTPTIFECADACVLLSYAKGFQTSTIRYHYGSLLKHNMMTCYVAFLFLYDI